MERKRLVVFALFVFAVAGPGLSAWAETLYVRTPTAKLRSGKAALDRVLATLKRGAAVEVIGREGLFVHVRTAEKKEGWVYNRRLSKEKPQERQEGGGILSSVSQSFLGLGTSRTAASAAARGVEVEDAAAGRSAPARSGFAASMGEAHRHRRAGRPFSPGGPAGGVHEMRKNKMRRSTVGALAAFAGFAMMGVASCGDVQVSTGVAGVDQTLRMARAAAPVAAALIPIGYAEERLIGQRMAQALAGKYGGLVDDAKLHNYVNLVGSAVALESGRPDIPYAFGVLNSESVNAFACPGGYVFITRGALRHLRNEAELAGVLAHEVAHVANQHVLNTIRRAKAFEGISRITAEALQTDTFLMSTLINAGLDTLLNKGLSREEEVEADTQGTQFAPSRGLPRPGPAPLRGDAGRVAQERGKG